MVHLDTKDDSLSSVKKTELCLRVSTSGNGTGAWQWLGYELELDNWWKLQILGITAPTTPRVHNDFCQSMWNWSRVCDIMRSFCAAINTFLTQGWSGGRGWGWGERVVFVSNSWVTIRLGHRHNYCLTFFIAAPLNNFTSFAPPQWNVFTGC